MSQGFRISRSRVRHLEAQKSGLAVDDAGRVDECIGRVVVDPACAGGCRDVGVKAHWIAAEDSDDRSCPKLRCSLKEPIELRNVHGAITTARFLGDQGNALSIEIPDDGVRAWS